MRFNEKLLSSLSEGKPVIEGRLHYKKIGGNLTHSGFQEKWFKLRLNILFYFNLTEAGTIDDWKPAGAFILENCIASQEIIADTPFSFKLQFADDKDKKHVFSGRTEQLIEQWVTALNSAPYDKLRAQILQMQSKLSHLSGQIHHEVNPHHQHLLEDPPDIFPKEPSFRSYIDSQSTEKQCASNADPSFLNDNFINGLGAIGQTKSIEQLKCSTASTNIFNAFDSNTPSNHDFARPHRKAPDPPKRPPRHVKQNVQENLIQF